MITPTKTVCFALWVNSDEWHRVYECDHVGVRIGSGWWSYGNFDRFVVREVLPFSELVKKRIDEQIHSNQIMAATYVEWREQELSLWAKTGLDEICQR